MSEEITREHAIGVITMHREHWRRLLQGNVCSKAEGEESIASFDMAIAALEVELATNLQQTCNNKQVTSKLVASDDAISRQEAKEAVKRASASGTVQMLLMEILDGMPSANPMPCEDAISREAILSKIKEVCFSEEWIQFRVDNGSNGQRDFLINYIEQLPPVTPKQRTGRWVESYINQIKGCDDIGHFYVCTECGRYINLKQGEKLSDYPYCHCGVKMVEPQESEVSDGD